MARRRQDVHSAQTIQMYALFHGSRDLVVCLYATYAADVAKTKTITKTVIAVARSPGVTGCIMKVSWLMKGPHEVKFESKPNFMIEEHFGTNVT
jgi:hypothetical protein